jgi:hypothetical protein
MNRPQDASDSQIHRLFEGRSPQAEQLDQAMTSADAEMQAIHVHPQESLVDVFQALNVGGFRVYAMPDGAGGQRLCIAKPWRIEAEKRRATEAARRASMTEEQIKAENGQREEMSRS